MADAETGSSPAASTGNKKELKWGLAIDLDYIRSLHGILTAVIAIVSLIAFICVTSGRSFLGCNEAFGSTYNFFGFVSMSAFLTEVFNYILYILSFNLKFEIKFIPWVLWDILYCGVWGFFYLIASAVVLAQTCGRGGNVAGGIFGFIVLGCMGVQGFFAFRKFREQRASSGSGPQSSGSPAEGSAEKQFEQY